MRSAERYFSSLQMRSALIVSIMLDIKQAASSVCSTLAGSFLRDDALYTPPQVDVFTCKNTLSEIISRYIFPSTLMQLVLGSAHRNDADKSKSKKKNPEPSKPKPGKQGDRVQQDPQKPKTKGLFSPLICEENNGIPAL